MTILIIPVDEKVDEEIENHFKDKTLKAAKILMSKKPEPGKIAGIIRYWTWPGDKEPDPGYLQGVDEAEKEILELIFGGAK